MHIKIKEGSKERIQVFEGTVIAKKHGGVNETFTVRRISYGVGVEKVFPVHSPNVVKVETVRKGRVRRAKLYYLRGRVGKGSQDPGEAVIPRRKFGSGQPLLFCVLCGLCAIPGPSRFVLTRGKGLYNGDQAAIPFRFYQFD